jgi:glycosyltransferase involved in cell wall biosynthesis
MRILITCDWFSPDTGGGAERVAFEVGRRMAAAGHLITVVAARPRGHDVFDLPEGLALLSVPAIDLAPLLHAQVSVAPRLPAAVYRAIVSVAPDVVWSHSLQFQSTPIAGIVARRRGIPFVVTAHIGDLDGVRGPIGLAARTHEATIGRAVLRLATRAIAVSAPVRDHIRSLEPRVPVDVVPNGVDLSRFKAVDLPHSGLRVGFLGRLVPNKGPDVAILALASAVRSGLDAHLSFAGDGPERPRLEQLAATLGLGERVRFEGYQHQPEAWLRDIDVLVRPSTTEGMPLAVLEAMACGVVVIASDVPGNASLLRHGELGLLVPRADPAALAEALCRLSADPSLRMRMRRAALEAAAGFSWDTTTELTLAVLRRATDSVARSRTGIMPEAK